MTDVSFTSEEHLRRIIERIVSRVGRRIDESSPLVDARLADGSRVNAMIPPLAFSGSSLTIRKFARDPFKVHDLIAFGTLTTEMAELLQACVEARLNVIVSGGTGTGKTTLLNVLSSFIPDDERIITIEDAVELQLQQDHVVRLESRPANIEGKGEVSIRDLVRNSLRMRPDRIVVGEVRGGESLDMLQAMNTGHEGSLSTVHANSPRDAMARLETLVLMAGMDLPLRAIREQIASAIDVIVQLSRLRDGTRRVTAVTEVQGMEGQTVTLQDAFLFDYAAGVDAAGRFLRPAVPDRRPTPLHRSFRRARHPPVPAGVRLRRPRPGAAMSQIFTLPPLTVVAVAMCGLAMLVGGYLVISPGPVRLSLARRRPGAEPGPGLLQQATTTVTRAIDRLLGRRGTVESGAVALELAGVKMKPQDFVLLLIAGTLAAGAARCAAGRPARRRIAGCGGAAGREGGPRHADQPSAAGVRRPAGRLAPADGQQSPRRPQPAAGAARRGPGVPRPASEEFARVINETRVGRDMAQALDETAARMDSEDFAWVAQAIAINRQVGGNLAEVLDTVGGTIRERGQIRRQVKALSAEGKLSAIVLMVAAVRRGRLPRAGQPGLPGQVHREPGSATA